MHIIKQPLIITTLFIQFLSAQTHTERLVLHIDVNKTIIAEDIANGKTLDDILIQSLAKSYKAQWSKSLSQPITYVQYVKDYLVPGDRSDKGVRNLRNTAILGFLEFLKTNQDPQYNIIKKRFDIMRKKVLHQPGKIFTSFYNLISYLEKNNITHSIILRTFGTDLDDISHELAKQINFEFEWEGYFIGNTLYITSLKTHEQKILKTIEDIHTFFKTCGHAKIKDDFTYWNSNHEKAEYGKLFPIATHDTTIKVIFFDDNAEDNIINPRHHQTGNFIDIGPLITHRFICPVDTLLAIEDDEYFIKHITSMNIIAT